MKYYCLLGSLLITIAAHAQPPGGKKGFEVLHADTLFAMEYPMSGGIDMWMIGNVALQLMGDTILCDTARLAGATKKTAKTRSERSEFYGNVTIKTRGQHLGSNRVWIVTE
jgi:hypothetical protein